MRQLKNIYKHTLYAFSQCIHKVQTRTRVYTVHTHVHVRTYMHSTSLTTFDKNPAKIRWWDICFSNEDALCFNTDEGKRRDALFTTSLDEGGATSSISFEKLLNIFTYGSIVSADCAARCHPHTHFRSKQQGAQKGESRRSWNRCGCGWEVRVCMTLEHRTTSISMTFARESITIHTMHPILY